VLRLCFRMESNAPVLGQTNLAPKYLTTSTPRLVVNDGQNAVAAPVFPCAILPRSQPHLRFHFSCNHSVHTSSSPSSPSKRRKSKQKEKLTECSSDGTSLCSRLCREFIVSNFFLSILFCNLCIRCRRLSDTTVGLRFSKAKSPWSQTQNSLS